MAELLLAKEVNVSLNEKTLERVTALKNKGVTPCLAILRVGEKEDDLSYERGATKRCDSLGILVKSVALPENVSTEEVVSVIEEMNKDKSVHGVLILKPLPSGLDSGKICNTLVKEKDVDCVTDLSAFGVYNGAKNGFAPCTPSGVMEIIHHYKIELRGKRAVVIGRSPVIGKPVSMLLLNEDATVTICHSKSENLSEICKEADILVAAAGKAKMITADFVKPGQVVIDVGIHVAEDGKLCGDVDFDSVSPIAGYITPVPGGVGGVTTSILASHVVTAAEKMMNN